MSAPFESFRVTTAGQHYGHFEVSVCPAHWVRGEDADVEKQRRFIREAIAEKLEREREAEAAVSGKN
jgi:hypothetical protein